MMIDQSPLTTTMNGLRYRFSCFSLETDFLFSLAGSEVSKAINYKLLFPVNNFFF